MPAFLRMLFKITLFCQFLKTLPLTQSKVDGVKRQLFQEKLVLLKKMKNVVVELPLKDFIGKPRSLSRS